MSLVRVGLVFGFTGVLASGAAQQSVDRVPTVSVETNLVMLPVAIIDRHGGFVPGLARDQFTVYDNGQRQPIEFFTNEDIPATVGLLIDSSSSMRGQRAAVTAAAAAFVQLSHPLDEFFTLNFNEAVWLGLPPGAAFAGNVEQLQAALTRAPAQGMTALYDAVDRALEHLSFGTRDHKALIIVSDGGDNASRQTLGGVLEHARRANAVIYAVVLIEPDNHDARPGVLKKLARETGGDVFAPNRLQDMESAFAHIAREIRSGYTIGFSPPDAADDAFRTVRVVVDTGSRRRLVVRTRPGYYVRRAEPTVR